MPDKHTHAGILNATTGRTRPPPLTDGHEMPHIEDRIADGHMTERARTVAICAAVLHASPVLKGYTEVEVFREAVDIVTRAEEWDRHERVKG